MYLSTIRIENFKNISKAIVNLNPAINCFVGENGSGKTNLMDAIFILCLTKSAFGASDSQCINFNSSYFRVEGIFKPHGENAKSVVVDCAYSSETKRIFRYNSIEYDRISEHIGRLPLVMVAPDDTDLIREGNEIRRKFFDGILCQMNAEYLQNLMVYNHLLKQRNAVLKQDKPAVDLIHLYDDKLIPLAIQLANTRSKFIEEFMPCFKVKYNYIASEKEVPLVSYISGALDENFKVKFKQQYEKDMAYQRTTMGVHTDEYEFTVSKQSVKKSASQGQKKSFAIALKLAQFDMLKESTETTPILLLDDIFDKLDDIRIKKLIELVASDAFGQIFVTDARPERSREVFRRFGNKVEYFRFERKSESETEVKLME